MRIKTVLPILKVERRERVASGLKNEKGDAVLTNEDLGWWIAFPGNFSIHVGNEEPDLKEGDKVILTIEKAK